MKKGTRVLVKQNGEEDWRNGYKHYFTKIDGKHLCYSGGDMRTFVSWDCVKEYKDPTLEQQEDSAGNCNNPYCSKKEVIYRGSGIIEIEMDLVNKSDIVLRAIGDDLEIIIIPIEIQINQKRPRYPKNN